VGTQPLLGLPSPRKARRVGFAILALRPSWSADALVGNPTWRADALVGIGTEVFSGQFSVIRGLKTESG